MKLPVTTFIILLSASALTLAGGKAQRPEEKAPLTNTPSSSEERLPGNYCHISDLLKPAVSIENIVYKTPKGIEVSSNENEWIIKGNMSGKSSRITLHP
ncbi:MAG TPA: hypothetical protein VIR63_05110, partial [Pontiella sp.]